jgi:hypothetical protein
LKKGKEVIVLENFKVEGMYEAIVPVIRRGRRVNIEC